MSKWGGLNRRNFPRVKFPCLVTIQAGAKTVPNAILTHTENVGIGGICVVVKENIKTFYPLSIEIDLLDASEHVKCKGKVVWNVSRGDKKSKKNMYDIGIEFEDMNADDQKRIAQVVQHFMKTSEVPYSDS